MAVASLWFGALSLFSAAGALLDVFTRRLPNLLCGAMLLVGLGLALMEGGVSALGLHFAHAGVALAIGYLLFMLGVWGGGDGKFYAATASFFPLWQMPGLFVAITLCGLAVAIIWFATARILRSGKARKDDFAKLPYGLPVAVGAIAQAVMVTQ